MQIVEQLRSQTGDKATTQILATAATTSPGLEGQKEEVGFPEPGAGSLGRSQIWGLLTCQGRDAAAAGIVT